MTATGNVAYLSEVLQYASCRFLLFHLFNSNYSFNLGQKERERWLNKAARWTGYKWEECVRCRIFSVGGEGRRRMSWPKKKSHLSHKSLVSEQGVKRHRHVNKLKTDTMRPQFLGLDWDCHLQYLWNVRGMTAEMEGGRNASGRLDRKEMPQNPVRQYEPQKLKWTHLCCCHWRSNWPVINHSTFAHFPPTIICTLTTNLKMTHFQLHYLQILECKGIFETEDFWRFISDLKEIAHTKMKMLSQFTHPHPVWLWYSSGKQNMIFVWRISLSLWKRTGAVKPQKIL